MRRALKLAARGQGRVEPNPMVGCVIVMDGRIIGEGYHRRFGGPHAEVAALRNCSGSARGATVYVTLEPCCHTGKTPPCTDALIDAGVQRVVAAIEDPNTLVAGKGLARLRAAGMVVERGLLADDARRLNSPFLKLIGARRPWVILKWAQSIDGKIATRSGDSKWITDEAARAHVHKVRARADAIVVGVNTVLTDDPLLTCRVVRPRRIARRLVLDSRLRTPLKARLVRTARDMPTWLFCARGASTAKRKRLEAAGCRVVEIPQTRRGLSLPALLDVLGKHSLTNVIVEGGGKLLGRFHDQRLADEAHIYIAPRLIGGTNAVGALHAVGSARVAGSELGDPCARLRPLGNGWLLQTRLTSAL